MKENSATKSAQATLSSSWARSGSFLESILSGALVGYLLDLWIGTEPWLVIAGVILGSYVGFMRIWSMLKEQDEYDRER